MADQAVIVKFDYVAPNLQALHELEDRLTQALTEAGEGECDGHDITPDLTKATLYLYGPDAEFVFVVAEQIIEYAECVQNAVATLRFGPPQDDVPTREIRVSKKTGKADSKFRPW